MKILLFDKSLEISKQIERNIQNIVSTPSISKVNNVDELLDQVSNSVFRFLIIDGDNLEGKFKMLIDIVKKPGARTYVFLFFSFNIEVITDKFLKNGADYCFDKLCGFDAFIEVFKSTYDEHEAKLSEYNN